MALRSITYAAKKMRVCPRTLKSLIDEGKIDAVKSSSMKYPKISDKVIEEFRGEVIVEEKFYLKELNQKVEINPFTGKPFPKSKNKKVA